MQMQFSDGRNRVSSDKFDQIEIEQLKIHDTEHFMKRKVSINGVVVAETTADELQEAKCVKGKIPGGNGKVRIGKHPQENRIPEGAISAIHYVAIKESKLSRKKFIQSNNSYFGSLLQKIHQ